jgi:hypothetical protein
MDSFAGVLAAIIILGAAVTKSVDLVRNAVDKDATMPPVTWNILAFVVGVAYCVGWQIDMTPAIISLIPSLADQSSRLSGVSGQVLTGMLAGGASGFAHDLFQNLSAGAALKRAKAKTG